MPLDEKLPRWDNEGVEIPLSKQQEGWAPVEKPPADWFNWLFNRIYKVLKELRQKVALKEDVADVATSVIDHLNDKANPHVVTKLQVGLGNVDNAKQATKTEFDNHANNKSNPHVVTTEQVNKIAAKLVGDLPAAYPDGLSLFNLSDPEVAAWKTATGHTGFARALVETSKISGTDYTIVQRIVFSTNISTTVFERSSTANNSWTGPWIKVVSRSEFDNLAGEVTAHKAETVKKTTADITYFISPTGNDSNNGQTSGTAFLTIGKAISMIPQIVNHVVNINVAAGTYNELVTISGFVGAGRVNLNGGTDLASAVNYNVNAIYIIRCSCTVLITGIKSIATTGVSAGFYSFGSVNSSFVYCIDIVTATSKIGFNSNYSITDILNCQVSNKSIGILSFNAQINSKNNAGSGNTTGLQAVATGTIGKDGLQPTGTTAEYAAQGGIVR